MHKHTVINTNKKQQLTSTSSQQADQTTQQQNSQTHNIHKHNLSRKKSYEFNTHLNDDLIFFSFYGKASTKFYAL